MVREFPFEFLDFARPTPLQREPVDLLSVANSVITLLFAELQENAIEIQTVDLDKLPTIEADVEQLKWVFTNLIKNAVEASPDGETITVTLDQNDTMCVRIRNKGAVPESIRDSFFDKYITAGKVDGTGLGTYSARLMVETQGGTIQLDSSELGATTVTVCLPLAEQPEL